MTGGSSPIEGRFTDEEMAALAAELSAPPTDEWYREHGICPSCKGMGGRYHHFGFIKTFKRDCPECGATGRV